MSIVIKDNDLIVVEAGNGAGVGTYSGYDLKEDIKQMIADRDIKMWYQKDPPPAQGSPDYAGLYDFWFDPSISALFIMVETEATVINSYTWVIVDPGDRKRLLQDASSTVKFPVGTSGQVWSHPETGVEYYFKFDRNQWIDIYAPAEDSIEANQDSIKVLDDKVEERVKIAGDTMTGDLTMQAGTVIDVGQINNLNNLIPAETLLVEADQTTRYSRIKPVGPRPVSLGEKTGMIIDLSEDDEHNNLVIMGSDTILSINGRANNSCVQFNKRVNAPTLELDYSGGLLLKADSSSYTNDPNTNTSAEYIRTYYPEGKGRTSALYFDTANLSQKLQIDNYPFKVVCTNGTRTDQFVDLINMARTSVDPDSVGAFCSIHNLVDPVDDMDAVNLQTLNTVTGDYLPLSGGNLTGNVNTDSLIKSTRNSGYAFEVKPSNATLSYLHSDGNAKFVDVRSTGVVNLDNGSSSGVCLQVKAYSGPDQRVVTSTWKSNGVLEINPTVTGSSYCFSVKATGLGTSDNVAFRVTADGKVKAGHDSSNPFLASSANDVMTKKATDNGYVQAGTPGIKITKTGNTYYIEGG